MAPTTHGGFALRGGATIDGWTEGTVALAYTTRSGRELFLTNAHVVSGPDACGFGEPVRASLGAGWRTVGTVYRMLPVETGRPNLFDVALVSPTVPVEPLLIGDPPERVAGCGRIAAAGAGPYFYTSGGDRVVCSSPEPLARPIPVEHGRNVVLYEDSIQLSVEEGRPVPGHSGSLLVREGSDGLIACGIVFAGNDEVLLVHEIEPALEALSGATASEDGREEDVRIGFPAPATARAQEPNGATPHPADGTRGDPQLEQGQRCLPLLITAQQTAGLLGVSVRHVYKLQSSGRLPRPVKLGRLVRWRSEELTEWIAAGAPDLDRWEAREARSQGPVRAIGRGGAPTGRMRRRRQDGRR